jgi:hypothetical protein
VRVQRRAHAQRDAKVNHARPRPCAVREAPARRGARQRWREGEQRARSAHTMCWRASQTGWTRATARRWTAPASASPVAAVRGKRSASALLCQRWRRAASGAPVTRSARCGAYRQRHTRQLRQRRRARTRRATHVNSWKPMASSASSSVGLRRRVTVEELRQLRSGRQEHAAAPQPPPAPRATHTQNGTNLLYCPTSATTS